MNAENRVAGSGGEFGVFLKGVAMGAANVIPGVSGGTIALITGIYQRLINALKQFGPEALRLFLRVEWRALWVHVDGRWLCVLMAGVAVSILTLARVFEYLLVEHEALTLAFFFGLILVSIVYVAGRVTRWSTASVLALLLGTALAIGIALLVPASENRSLLYVFLCGVLAISSMILPGLSGSFVLIVLGNYTLVLGAINSFDLAILLPFLVGCVVGLIAFSHVLAWIFDRFPDQTLALMSGFVIGSLAIIWPWKSALTRTVTPAGREPREVVTGYDWFLPSLGSAMTWLAIGLMVLGGLLIVLMERTAGTDSGQ